MKGEGMLVVSLRGVNFGFWSRLGCSGQNTIIFSRKGLFQGCTRGNIKKLYFFDFLYLLDSRNQSLKLSLLGVKKRLGHAQIGLLQGFNSKFPTSIPTPFICRVRPRATCFLVLSSCNFVSSSCGGLWTGLWTLESTITYELWSFVVYFLPCLQSQVLFD